MDIFAERMQALKFEPPEWRLEPTEKRVAEFETRFSLALPPDYRRFLLEYGGYFGSGLSPFLEPTPLGDTAVFIGFYGFTTPQYGVYSLDWATDMFEVAPDFVPVGIGAMNGCSLLLQCTGDGKGSVYFHDAQQRSLWSDEQFHGMFCNLSPLIVRYLEQRRAGQLPKKPEGYESLYLLGRSYTEFIEGLHPDPDEED